MHVSFQSPLFIMVLFLLFDSALCTDIECRITVMRLKFLDRKIIRAYTAKLNSDFG